VDVTFTMFYPSTMFDSSGSTALAALSWGICSSRSS
jgi:hypothetical protein